MKPDDLLDAIGEIEDSYLETAYEKQPKRAIKWIGIGSLAACFLLILLIPLGFLHGMNQMSEVDYSSKDITRFSVYYADGEALSHLTYEIHGGYEEMFFAWKNQNGIGKEVLLQDITLLNASLKEDFDGELQSEKILRITVSASFSAYLEENKQGLLLESLKKTVASYMGAKIADIELIFVE